MNYIVVFSDTHNAIKGENSLIEAGLKVSVMPLPESIGNGCGITLRVSGEILDVAIETLRNSNTSVLAVYSREKGPVGYVYELFEVGVHNGTFSVNS